MISYRKNEDPLISAIFRKDTAIGFRAIIFLIIALLLMAFDQQSVFFRQVKSYFTVAVVPIQYVVSFPINMISWIGNDFTSHQSLVAENTHLKAQLLLLQSKLQQQYAIEAENQQLKALLRSSTKAQGKVLEAQLLAVAPDPFIRQVVVNKGSLVRVYVGQPVLDANGVMGQVVAVGKLTSRVMLLTDPQSAIPVQISRNGLRMIAVGDSALGLLKLVHVPDTADIQVGDALITSGLGQNFPYGYPVGKVMSIKHSPGKEFAEIKVMPTAHLNQSRLVLLVWPVITAIDTNIKEGLHANHTP